MASYTYVCANDNYMDGSADAEHNVNFLATYGSTLRLATNRTIPSSDTSGYTGEICRDQNFIYVCVADNTWKRAALGSF